MTDRTTQDLCTITGAARIIKADYRRAYDLALQGRFGEPILISQRAHYAVAAVKRFAKQQAQEATL